MCICNSCYSIVYSFVWRMISHPSQFSQRKGQGGFAIINLYGKMWLSIYTQAEHKLPLLIFLEDENLS